MLSPITRRDLNCKVRICGALSKEKDELIVWWYGGIVKNYKAETVPWVIVFFRKLDENGNLGISVSRKVALTFLGLLRIGTIWKNGECKAEAVMPVVDEKCYVDFTQGAWKFVSPMQAARSGAENPINQDDYLLPFSYDKNWLIDFPLANDKNLLIPCTEFFVRYYGRSEEVPRVLATYGWAEVNRRFYVPFDQPATPDSWPVKLRSRMYNNDVVFLAHMKYDPYPRDGMVVWMQRIRSLWHSRWTPLTLNLLMVIIPSVGRFFRNYMRLIMRLGQRKWRPILILALGPCALTACHYSAI